jgi:glycosyltransferase involved in cell wall biosynthesis
MSKQLELSFVVNTFNHERFIGTCLSSIFALEDAPDFEVVVIDDCSTDNTEAVVRSFQDTRLIYLRNEVNLNAAASVSRAFEVARGKFIARIDADDAYRPHFLKRTLPVLREHESVGLVYGDIEMMDAEGVLNGGTAQVAQRRNGRPWIDRELVPLMYENYIPAATMIARREAWDLVMPVPAGRNFCDWYWTLNMARKWDFAFINEVLSNYRLHAGNMHKDMVREKYGESITWLNLREIFAAEDFGSRHVALENEVYASHCAQLGQKYYGFLMMEDGRRCLAEALTRMPQWCWQRPQLVKWWLASWLPKSCHRREWMTA